jgi:glycosyltransferase involved in cell wall biosynthesis
MAASRLRTSVIIPTYNRRALIGATIESVLAQTRAADQIIVVDDGSTDDTAALVATYAPRVRYLRQPNQGQQAARNLGVRASDGDLVLLLDSDDLWDPHFIEQNAAIHEEHGDVLLSFCNFRIVQDGAWSEQTKFDMAPAGYWDRKDRADRDGCWVFQQPIYDMLIDFQPAFPSALAIRRKYFDAIGGYDIVMRGIKSEDFEFILRACQESPMAAVHAPLVGIRKHESNDSGDALGLLLGEISVLQHALQHHPAAVGHRNKIEASIVARSIRAADAAFVRAEFDLMRKVLQAVPNRAYPAKLALKSLIAGLPPPIARMAHRLTRAAGTT